MPGRVVLLEFQTEPIAFHEERRHEALARMIAEIKGYEFAGPYDPASRRRSPLYFVPHYTVIGLEIAARAGICTLHDLFGGVVPWWFLATKAVTHELVRPEATRPESWRNELLDDVADYVLPGYTAFDPRDAFEAGDRLLRLGRVRLKDVFAAGGNGQIVVGNTDELSAGIDKFRQRDQSHWCIVLELNLEEMTTYSVGQIHLADMTISYWGTQRVTQDNFGRHAYGGSDLNVVRGGFEAAAESAPSPEEKHAVRAAMAFDSAVHRTYPDIFASRRNYDVGCGRDARGVLRCGVIDQSWRIGGTSGVEVAAVHAFKNCPKLQFVKGSSFNVYGAGSAAPANAIVHFHDIDHEFGPMLMYTLLETRL